MKQHIETNNFTLVRFTLVHFALALIAIAFLVSACAKHEQNIPQQKGITAQGNCTPEVVKALNNVRARTEAFSLSNESAFAELNVAQQDCKTVRKLIGGEDCMARMSSEEKPVATSYRYIEKHCDFTEQKLRLKAATEYTK